MVSMRWMGVGDELLGVMEDDEGAWLRSRGPDLDDGHA